MPKKLSDAIDQVLAACSDVEAYDGAAVAAVLSRIAARMYCRVGDSADFVAMATHHARMEHRFHGEVPSVVHPTASAWKFGMGIHPDDWNLATAPVPMRRGRGRPRKYFATTPVAICPPPTSTPCAKEVP
jgi:hypothetical protein